MPPFRYLLFDQHERAVIISIAAIVYCKLEYPMAKITKRKAKRRDPIELAMEDALQPGHYVAWNEGGYFVSGLRRIEEEIGKLAGCDLSRAANLYEIFIAGCNEKAEEIDDSDGVFGMFPGCLFCGWIKARQAMEADRAETSRLLLAWMDDDSYGFCNDLAPQAVKVLDRPGLESFERDVRARLDAALDKQQRKPAAGRDYDSQRWGEILKTIYTQQRNIPKYVELATRTEVTPVDCEAIATMLQARRRLNDALSWVERGLKIQKPGAFGIGAGYKLSGMRRALLTKLGRGGEALDSAWAEFEAHPGELTYDELFRFVPKAERGAWHERAMAVAGQGELACFIELCLKAKEFGRLAERLDRASDTQIEGISHYVTEPAAERLAAAHPGTAAKVFAALCVRILDAGKSKYYYEALSNLEKARNCYERAGLHAQWTALAAEIRRAHCRKTGFMPGFERIVAGKWRSLEPSFLERAKGHWARRART
ncbi:MAG: DUF6880 family protein [Bryobacteraceae bacterium]